MLKKLLVVLGLALSTSVGSTFAMQRFSLGDVSSSSSDDESSQSSAYQVPDAIADHVQGITTREAFRNKFPTHFDASGQLSLWCQQNCLQGCTFDANWQALTAFYDQLPIELDPFENQSDEESDEEEDDEFQTQQVFNSDDYKTAKAFRAAHPEYFYQETKTAEQNTRELTAISQDAGTTKGAFKRYRDLDSSKRNNFVSAERCYQALLDRDIEKVITALKAKYPDLTFTDGQYGISVKCMHPKQQSGYYTPSFCAQCTQKFDTDEITENLQSLYRIKQGHFLNYYSIEEMDELLYGRTLMGHLKHAAVATAYAGVDFAWPVHGEANSHRSMNHDLSVGTWKYLAQSTNVPLMGAHWMMLGGLGACGYAAFKILTEAHAQITRENKAANKTMNRTEHGKAVVKRAIENVKKSKLTDNRWLVGGAAALTAGTVGTIALNTEIGQKMIIPVIEFFGHILWPQSRGYWQEESSLDIKRALAHWLTIAGIGSAGYALYPLFKQAYTDVTTENAKSNTTMTKAELSKTVTTRVIDAIKKTNPADQKTLIAAASAFGALIIGSLGNAGWNAVSQRQRYSEQEYDFDQKPGMWSRFTGFFSDFFAGNDRRQFEDENF